MNPCVPIVILAGSDRRAPPAPSGQHGMRFIVGYKGAQIRIGGQPLVSRLDERLRASRVLGDVYLAGPAARYSKLVRCPIIDTDRDVGRNIRAAVDFIGAEHGRDIPIAFIASDILPTTEEVDDLGRRLLDETEDTAPRPGSDPPFFAMALVDAAAELDSSSWKPRYGIRPHRGAPPRPYLPAHLGIIKPAHLRMRLLYRLLELAYVVRNRDFGQRRRVILPRITMALLKQDLANLLAGRAPSLTYKVLRHGLATISRWRHGTLDLQSMARGMAAVFVKRTAYRRWGASAVRLVTCPHQSFARDIDTHEEVVALDGAEID